MKNFIKGFSLGFGLMLCFFIGIVVTKAYEFFIIPQSHSYYNIKALGMDIKKAKQLADEYSKELNSKCQIAEFSMDLAPVYLADENPILESEKEQTKADDSKDSQNENKETDQDDKNELKNITQEEITPLAAPLKMHKMGYLRLECDQAK